MNIAILILAAGSSSRMGEPKQLLSIKNTTLLGYSIEQAKQSNANKVFCVLGANAEAIEQSIKKYIIEIINNSNYQNGLSSSIKVGIQHIEVKHFDAVLIMLADQPKVDSNYLNTLIRAFEKNLTQISASSYSGNIGVPAVFPKFYFEQLKNLKGDKGARELLNSHKNAVILFKNNHLIDIDTKQDYDDLLKSMENI
jgi:molybdenum cofactor cytidylyltransferase